MNLKSESISQDGLKRLLIVLLEKRSMNILEDTGKQGKNKIGKICLISIEYFIFLTI